MTLGKGPVNPGIYGWYIRRMQGGARNEREPARPGPGRGGWRRRRHPNGQIVGVSFVLTLAGLVPAQTRALL
jgi:hypothetical protein